MPPKGKSKVAVSDAGAGMYTIYGAAALNGSAVSNFLDSHISGSHSPFCVPVNSLSEVIRSRNASERAAAVAATSSVAQVDHFGASTALDSGKPQGKGASSKPLKGGRLDESLASPKGVPAAPKPVPSSPASPQPNPHQAAVRALGAPPRGAAENASQLFLEAENRLMNCVRIANDEGGTNTVTVGGGAFDVFSDSKSVQSVVHFGSESNSTSDPLSINTSSVVGLVKIPHIYPGESVSLDTLGGACYVESMGGTDALLVPQRAAWEPSLEKIKNLLATFTNHNVGSEEIARLITKSGWSSALISQGQESQFDNDTAPGLQSDFHGLNDVLGVSLASPSVSRPVTSQDAPPRPQSTGKKGGDSLGATLSGGTNTKGAVDATAASQNQFSRHTGIASFFRGYHHDKRLYLSAKSVEGKAAAVGGTLASWPSLLQEAPTAPAEVPVYSEIAQANIIQCSAVSTDRTFGLFLTAPRNLGPNEQAGSSELLAVGLLDGEAEVLGIAPSAQASLQKTTRLFRQLIPKTNVYRGVLTGSSPSRISSGAKIGPADHEDDEIPQEYLQKESSIIGVASGSSHCLILIYDHLSKQTYVFGRGVLSNCGGALGSSFPPPPAPAAIGGSGSPATSGSHSSLKRNPSDTTSDGVIQVSAVIKGRSQIFVNKSGGTAQSSQAGVESSFRSRNANTAFWGASIGQGGPVGSSTAPVLSFVNLAPVEAFCGKGVYSIFAAKHVTFAATQEGLFVLGTLDLSNGSSGKHVFARPTLVLPLAACTSVVSVSVSDNEAVVLVDNGDLFVFDNVSKTFSPADVRIVQPAAPGAVSSSHEAQTAAGAAIQASLTCEKLSSILQRRVLSCASFQSGTLDGTVAGDEGKQHHTTGNANIASLPHDFHVFPVVQQHEEFSQIQSPVPISRTPDSAVAGHMVSTPSTTVGPIGIAVRIMTSVDDDVDGTHISSGGFVAPVLPVTVNEGFASLSGTTNNIASGALPSLYTSVIAGGVGELGYDGGDGLGTRPGSTGRLDAAEGDLRDGIEGDVEGELSDDQSAFSEVASTQPGGGSNMGSPTPAPDPDDYVTPTSDATGTDTRLDPSSLSPSRKTGTIRQQQQKDFLALQQQHTSELRALQSQHRQRTLSRLSCGKEPLQDGHFVAVKNGKRHFIAQTRSGQLYGWGGNEFGQLTGGQAGSCAQREGALQGNYRSPQVSLSSLILPYDSIAATALEKYHKTHFIPSLVASLQLLHNDNISKAFDTIKATAPASTTPMQLHLKLRGLLQSSPTGEFILKEPSFSAQLPHILVSALFAISPADVFVEGFVCLPWASVVTVSVVVRETRRVTYVEHASTLQQVAAAERNAAAAAAASAPKKKGKPATPSVPKPDEGPTTTKKVNGSSTEETTFASAKITVSVAIGSTNRN